MGGRHFQVGHLAIKVLDVQVTSTTLMPLLVHVQDPYCRPENVLDEYFGDLFVAYSFGPPYGERLVTWRDLERMGMAPRILRRHAAANLDTRLADMQVHGQPPALMISFGGIESSLLLADELWGDLERAVPGELVIGVPARDVVIVTGSESRPGLAKARRAIDRVFFAGNQNHLLVRDLLVRRRGFWERL